MGPRFPRSWRRHICRPARPGRNNPSGLSTGRELAACKGSARFAERRCDSSFGESRGARAGDRNSKLATGEIELIPSQLRILNRADDLPFPIDVEIHNEDLRLTYRYYDLRRPELSRNLRLRHRAAKATRDYLDSQGYIEIETPILSKSTPEGARDFLVPSRLMPGKFYALPQAPQQYKQLLQVAGVEKYFQIAKCFRDEDLRADRQPEF